MAKQTGILKLKGPIGGLSFYHHKHYGWLARQSNPVDPKRIRRDPAFARMRENMSEFGRASSAGKLMRHGLREFLREIGTDFLDNRTMKLMMGIKNEDAVSERGKRNVSTALASKPELLGDFELHFRETLFRFLGQHPVVDKLAGTVSLKNFVPFHAPKAATHVALTAFRGRLDFEMDERDFTFSEELVYPLDGVEREVILSIESQSEFGSESGLNGERSVEIWGMKVVYMQEVNGELYSLAVGAAKVLGSSLIMNDSIMNDSITNGGITNYELADGSITNGLIRNDIITNGSIRNDSIRNDIITNGSITNGSITNDSIRNDSIANDSIRNDIITNGSITNGSITNGSIANGSITNGLITNDSIRNDSIANDSIANGLIRNDIIMNGSIRNGLITNGSITNGGITNWWMI